jgi:hypothetical protein
MGEQVSRPLIVGFATTMKTTETHERLARRKCISYNDLLKAFIVGIGPVFNRIK